MTEYLRPNLEQEVFNAVEMSTSSLDLDLAELIKYMDVINGQPLQRDERERVRNAFHAALLVLSRQKDEAELQTS